MTEAFSAEDSARILEALPHRPPMRLVDDVVSATHATIVCRAHLDADHILARDGVVSTALAIELFAQAAAALMVHRARQGTNAPVSGMLLGTRKVEILADAFRVGETLTVAVGEKWTMGELSQFEGHLYRDGELVAQGSINVAQGT